MKALVYLRNSSASERSVDEQETECRADCDRLGYEVETVVTDMVGASKHSKGTRHGWARAKKLLPAHDVLVTWECSRAQRDLADYAELRDLCAANGVLWCYSGRVHDVTTSDGAFTTGLDALLAERESAVIRERVARAMRANAAAGKPHGRVLFGYQRTYDPTSGAVTGQVPHPIEAPIVREMFSQFLAGKSLYTIARWVDEQGITTSKGRPWQPQQVRSALRRPAYCGRRVHRGEVVGSGCWEPIVSEETFNRAQQRLDAPGKWGRSTTTARMLTGVARCFKCGSRTTAGKNRGRRVYVCSNRLCLGVARDLASLDRYISRLVIARLEDGIPFDLPAPQADDIAAEVDALRARLDDAVGQFTAGRLSAGTLAKIEGDLLPAIAAAEAKRRRVGVPLDIELPEDGDYDRWWDETLEPEQRRAIASHLISSVTIHPATPGAHKFDPLSVKVEWKVTPGS